MRALVGETETLLQQLRAARKYAEGTPWQEEESGLYEGNAATLDAATDLYAHASLLLENARKLLAIAPVGASHKLLVSEIEKDKNHSASPRLRGACYTQIWNDETGRSRQCRVTQPGGCYGLMRNLKKEYFPGLACEAAGRIFASGLEFRKAVRQPQPAMHREIRDAAQTLRDAMTTAASSSSSSSFSRRHQDRGACVSRGTGPIGEMAYECEDGPGALARCAPPPGGVLSFPFTSCTDALAHVRKRGWTENVRP